MTTLNIFTDGAAFSNSKDAACGCAVYIPFEDFKVGKSLYGTNNIAELSSIKYALYLVLKNFEHFNPTVVAIYSDSTYAINVITGKYNAKANKELVNKCQELVKKLNDKTVKVDFKWVKAHTGNTDYYSKCNDVVDKIANSEAMSLEKTHVISNWHRC